MEYWIIINLLHLMFLITGPACNTNIIKLLTLLENTEAHADGLISFDFTVNVKMIFPDLSLQFTLIISVMNM